MKCTRPWQICKGEKARASEADTLVGQGKKTWNWELSLFSKVNGTCSCLQATGDQGQPWWLVALQIEEYK